MHQIFLPSRVPFENKLASVAIADSVNLQHVVNRNILSKVNFHWKTCVKTRFCRNKNYDYTLMRWVCIRQLVECWYRIRVVVKCTQFRRSKYLKYWEEKRVNKSKYFSVAYDISCTKNKLEFIEVKNVRILNVHWNVILCPTPSFNQRCI